MNESDDRREFSRFPIDFSLVVTGIDPNNLEFREHAVLSDVSGGGASFVSLKECQYFKNQVLNISIDLPGSADVGGSMQTTATVIRIESENDSKDSAKARVVIEFNKPLHFDRFSAEAL